MNEFKKLSYTAHYGEIIYSFNNMKMENLNNKKAEIMLPDGHIIEGYLTYCESYSTSGQTWDEGHTDRKLFTCVDFHGIRTEVILRDGCKIKLM